MHRELREAQRAIGGFDADDLIPRRHHQVFLLGLNDARAEPRHDAVPRIGIELAKPRRLRRHGGGIRLDPRLRGMRAPVQGRADQGPILGAVVLMSLPIRLVQAIDQLAPDGVAPRSVGRPLPGGVVGRLLQRHDRAFHDDFRARVAGGQIRARPRSRGVHAATTHTRGSDRGLQQPGEALEIPLLPRREGPREVHGQLDHRRRVAAVEIPDRAPRRLERGGCGFQAEARVGAAAKRRNHARHVLGHRLKPARAHQPREILCSVGLAQALLERRPGILGAHDLRMCPGPRARKRLELIAPDVGFPRCAAARTPADEPALDDHERDPGHEPAGRVRRGGCEHPGEVRAVELDMGEVFDLGVGGIGPGIDANHLPRVDLEHAGRAVHVHGHLGLQPAAVVVDRYLDREARAIRGAPGEPGVESRGDAGAHVREEHIPVEHDLLGRNGLVLRRDDVGGAERLTRGRAQATGHQPATPTRASCTSASRACSAAWVYVSITVPGTISTVDFDTTATFPASASSMGSGAVA